MIQMLNADARRIPLADKSVNCVITSPPYYGLRDYGVEGQIGLEPTPNDYVAELVEAFREVWRVLRDDGVVFLNLGDSYAGGGRGGNSDVITGYGKNMSIIRGKRNVKRWGGGNIPAPVGLKPKDLIGIPWRVAFALQADGWYLRSDIIWHKTNPMPESVKDRPARAHEYLFLFAKSTKYFFDHVAIKEFAVGSEMRPSFRGGAYINNVTFDNSEGGKSTDTGNIPGQKMRNSRSVWEIATQPTKLAHFATMPEKLAERCVNAGTSKKGICPICGAPFVRIIKKTNLPHSGSANTKYNQGAAANRLALLRQAARENGYEYSADEETVGWKPSCAHREDPVPAIVLDNFAGSGTTLQVARALGRNAIGLDLSIKYIHECAQERLGNNALKQWGNGISAEANLDALPLFDDYRILATDKSYA